MQVIHERSFINYFYSNNLDLECNNPNLNFHGGTLGSLDMVPESTRYDNQLLPDKFNKGCGKNVNYGSLETNPQARLTLLSSLQSVSYTHLDVYKRQK